MERAGLDALIALSGDVHAFQQPNAVMLLTGFRAIGDSYVVLRKDGETDAHGVAGLGGRSCRGRLARNAHRRRRTIFARRLSPTSSNSPSGSARLGVVGLDTLGYGDACWLTQMLGARAHRFDQEFLAQTRQKSPAEIRSAERATRGRRAGLRAAARTGAAGRQRDRPRDGHLRRDGGRRRRRQFPDAQRGPPQPCGPAAGQSRARSGRHHPVRDLALGRRPVLADLPHRDGRPRARGLRREVRAAAAVVPERHAGGSARRARGRCGRGDQRQPDRGRLRRVLRTAAHARPRPRSRLRIDRSRRPVRQQHRR